MDKIQDGIEAYAETRLYRPKNPTTEPRVKLEEAIRANYKAIKVIEDHIERIRFHQAHLIGSPYHKQLVDAKVDVENDNAIYLTILNEANIEDDEAVARRLQAEFDRPLPASRPIPFAGVTAVGITSTGPTNIRYTGPLGVTGPPGPIPNTNPMSDKGTYDDWYSGIQCTFFNSIKESALNPQGSLREQMHVAGSIVVWEQVHLHADPMFEHIRLFLDLFASVHISVNEMYAYFPLYELVVGFRYNEGLARPGLDLDTVLRDAAAQYRIILAEQQMATRLELHSRRNLPSAESPFLVMRCTIGDYKTSLGLRIVDAVNVVTGLHLTMEVSTDAPVIVVHPGNGNPQDVPRVQRVWTNLNLGAKEYENIEMAETKMNEAFKDSDLCEHIKGDWQPVFQPTPRLGKKLDIKPYLDLFIEYSRQISEIYIYSDSRRRVLGLRYRRTTANILAPTALVAAVQKIGEAYAKQCQKDASVKRVDLHNVEVYARGPVAVLAHEVRGHSGASKPDRYIDVWLEKILDHNGFYISVEGKLPGEK